MVGGKGDAQGSFFIHISFLIFLPNIHSFFHISGIVPRVSNEIFTRGKQDPSTTLSVETSMLEIYNEEVRDLLNPARPVGGLKVREFASLGVQVDGLHKQKVACYEDVEKLFEQGNKLKVIGATKMNATSSRSHTLFIISINQKSFDKTVGKIVEKNSKLTLVDLAGSEKLGQTGAEGQRAVESVNINLSLTNLGMVINRFAVFFNFSSKSFSPLFFFIIQTCKR